MLLQILQSIHNFFIRKPNPGTYRIDGAGKLPISFLQDGQRFWIVGSAMNDGVYTWHPGWIGNDDDTEPAALKPETFSGSVCSLAVPPEILSVAEEASAWQEAYADKVANSPYSSESVIGVYSYTKATGGTGAGGGVPWADVFKSRLDPYRKVSGP